MNLSKLQNTVYECVMNQPLLILFMKYSRVLALIYPVYLVLNRIPYLNPVISIIAYVGAILYGLYLIGILLCFAKREMIYVVIAFACRTLAYIISLVHYFSISSILCLALYAALTVLSYRCHIQAK